MRISLHRALLWLIATVLVAGLVPAGLVLDRRLASALESRARDDLRRAPMILSDREAMTADALAMHARQLASTQGLADALVRGDRDRGRRLVQAAARSFEEEPILVGSDGSAWVGPSPAPGTVAAARTGGTAPRVLTDESSVRQIALVPLERNGVWVGAAGVQRAFDGSAAGTLSGLTRSEVVVLTGGGEPVASTADTAVARAIADSGGVWRDDGRVHDLRLPDGRRYLVAAAGLGGAATVAFARDLGQELAVLPRLRRVAAVSGVAALVLAVLLGAVMARVVARPVGALSAAADRLAAGDFQAPLPETSLREVDRLADAFDEMRRALQARLSELEGANRELADRQDRLTALQAELIQRDRLAAAGRLVTELAHEIRNPVANVRNCIEVVRRRLPDDSEARRFADMAIDELLRMHGLAEQMLELNRPREAEASGCDPRAVVDEVVSLVRAGAGDAALAVSAEGPRGLRAGMAADALKQVILNVVQNSREAVGDRGRIDIRVAKAPGRVHVDVLDDGPGIPEEIRDRVFDPFFTTKTEVSGVGLGLYVAAGLMSRCSGRITVENRNDGPGARVRLEIPVLAEDGQGRTEESAGRGSPVEAEGSER